MYHYGQLSKCSVLDPVSSADEDDDDDFLNDPELERYVWHLTQYTYIQNDADTSRLREMRLAKLKKEHAEKQENLAKGHGQYRYVVSVCCFGRQKVLMEMT